MQSQVSAVFGQGYGHQIAIVVPATRDIRVPLSHEEHITWVHLTIKFLSGLRNGGASAFQQIGGWTTEAGDLVIEPNSFVYTYVDEVRQDDLDNIKVFVQNMKAALGQEAVLIAVNGVAYFY